MRVFVYAAHGGMKAEKANQRGGCVFIVVVAFVSIFASLINLTFQLQFAASFRVDSVHLLYK